MSVLVAGQIDRPDTLPVLFQRQGPHAGPAVAPAVEVDRYLLRRGRPEPEPGAGGVIFRPQRAAVACLPCKGAALEQRFPLCGRFHFVPFPSHIKSI